MSIQVKTLKDQGLDRIFGGKLEENHPIPFQREDRDEAYSNLFYWANAIAKERCKFELHPHKGFEIMSFMLKGEVIHYDTAKKEEKTISEGDIQVINAGEGVYHSEELLKDARMFQIWFDPDFTKSLKNKPIYKDYKKELFKWEEENGYIVKNLVGENTPIVPETKFLEVKKIKFRKETNIDMNIDKNMTYSFYVLDGQIEINGQTIELDSHVIINDLDNINIKTEEEAEIFLIKSVKNPDYLTMTDFLKDQRN